MATIFDTPGGIRKANSNERITTDMLNDFGLMVHQTVFAIIGRLFTDAPGSPPADGFFGDDLICEVTGALQVTVRRGYGFFWDPTVTDPFDAAYRPVVNEADVAQAIDAHDATNPRIDLLVAAPATIDDETASVQIKDPVTGVVAPQSLTTRRRFISTITYIAGTPAASPVAPAVPAGAQALAEVNVPATAGALTITDRRKILRFGESTQPDPPTDYSDPYVSDSGGDITAGGAGAEDVDIGGLVAVIDGVRVRIYPETVPVLTADPGQDRVDIITATKAGGLTYYAGTPAANPEPPVTPPLELLLHEILVPAAVPDSTSYVFTDAREFAPIGPTSVQNNTINQNMIVNDRLQGAFVYEKSVPDLNLRVDRGLANVAGSDTFVPAIETDGLAITAASVGMEKVSILQVDASGVMSVKDGVEVAAGSGTAAYPAPDSGKLLVAELFTAAVPITNATTQIAQTNIRNTARTWI